MFRNKRAIAMMVGASLAASALVGGAGLAASAETPASAIPDGVYLVGSGQVEPGGRISILYAGPYVEVTPGNYQGPSDCYGPPSFQSEAGGAPIELEPWGMGFPWYGEVRDVLAPASLSGAGTVIIPCYDEFDSVVSTVSLPIVIGSVQPASTYRSPWMYTFDQPAGSSIVTVSKVGYTPGESVTITAFDELLSYEDFATSFAPPQTVIADGEGAVTTKIQVPSNWTDLQVLFSSSTSRLAYDTSGDGETIDGTTAFTSSASVPPGGQISVSGTGYAPNENVVVALHSASDPALVLATVTANGSGAIAASVTIPPSVSLGSYRVWAGSKTGSYLLQNAPLRVENVQFADGGGPTDLFYQFIQWMSTTGISTGTVQAEGLPLYKPVDSVSRQAMAAFMYRLSGDDFVAPIEQTFADVDSTSPFYLQIEWMADRNISTGTAQPSGKPLFNPSAPVSRQAMALFLARYGVVDVSTPPASQSFADVPTASSVAAAIDWMKSTGISTGTAQPSGLPLYKPVDPVSRQAMAAFLYRLDQLG